MASCFKRDMFIQCVAGILVFVMALQIVNVCLGISLGDKDSVKGMIISDKLETPIYDLHFNTFIPSDVNNNFQIFFYFQGREEKLEKDNETSNKISIENSTNIYADANISKIYQNYFIYKKDERTYFDYLIDFTVKAGENCKNNYKQCGIFNEKGRILCLPNEEECPLNGFGISDDPLDSNYDNIYNKYEVSDIITNKKYYFFYTNKNINGKVITEFKLSNGFPCYVSWQESWISVFPDEYKIEECYTKDKDGNDRDNTYIIIADLSLKSLYVDNNINITDANSSINSIVNIYANNFNYKIENEECITDFFLILRKKRILLRLYQ